MSRLARLDVAAMIGPHAFSPVEKSGSGLGLVHGGSGSSARIGHSSEDPGFSCRAWTYPASAKRMAVQSNVTEGAWLPFKRLDELLAAVPG